MISNYRHLSNFKLFLSCLLLSTSLTACTDTPKSAAKRARNPEDRNPTRPPANSVIKTKALKYQGQDTLGRSCNLSIALLEGTHTKFENNHNHNLIIKLDYTTSDGHKPVDSETTFYQYNASSGEYYHEDDSTNNTSLVLLSINLRDNTSADANLLNSYITNNELKQYIRVEFTDNRIAHDYLENLEQALETENTNAIDMNVFNKISLISLGLAHGDHYHFPVCLNQKAQKVEMTTFNMEAHDHDHDQGDDHDHDHDHN